MKKQQRTAVHFLDGWDWKDRAAFGGMGAAIILLLLALLLKNSPIGNWKTEIWSMIASWIQAIGSIAAIYGAGHIANAQFLKQRKAEEQAEMEIERKATVASLGIKRALVVSCASMFDQIGAMDTSDALDWEFHRLRLEDFHQQFASPSPTMVRSEVPSDVIALNTCRQALISLISRIKKIESLEPGEQRKELEKRVIGDSPNLHKLARQISGHLYQRLKRVATPLELDEMGKSMAEMVAAIEANPKRDRPAG